MSKQCSVINCDRKSSSRGWCTKHYDVWRKTGNPETPNKSGRPRKHDFCTESQCTRRHFGKGLCSRHYKAKFPLQQSVSKKLSVDYKFSRGKASALSRGIDWNLSLQEYKDLMKQECYYECGNALSQTSLGLDRILNDVGYQVNNVVPCCKNCNISRNIYFTIDEWKVMIKTVKQYRETKK